MGVQHAGVAFLLGQEAAPSLAHGKPMELMVTCIPRSVGSAHLPMGGSIQDTRSSCPASEGARRRCNRVCEPQHEAQTMAPPLERESPIGIVRDDGRFLNGEEELLRGGGVAAVEAIPGR